MIKDCEESMAAHLCQGDRMFARAMTLPYKAEEEEADLIQFRVGFARPLYSPPGTTGR